jgi:hypothetical protein
MSITYMKGDATFPTIPTGKTGFIVHIVNARGGWGKGFVLAVSKRWPEPESAYRRWFHNKYDDGKPFELGQVQYVKVEPNLYVCNIVAQSGYGRNNLEQHQSETPNSTPPIRYMALETGLSDVGKIARRIDAVVVGPRLGSGLAGGDWSKIEGIINSLLHDVPVYIYDL